MNHVKPPARRVVQTCLVVLLTALATVSIGAFAQQGNRSANSQQHEPGANYWHRVRPTAPMPPLPGNTERELREGRASRGGCDAVDVMDGGRCNPAPPPPPCNDPNASNRGGPLPCQCNTGFAWNGSACQDTICRNPDASNYGEALPCKLVCNDPDADNFGGPLPCLCPHGQPMVNGGCPGGPDKPEPLGGCKIYTHTHWNGSSMLFRNDSGPFGPPSSSVNAILRFRPDGTLESQLQPFSNHVLPFGWSSCAIPVPMEYYYKMIENTDPLRPWEPGDYDYSSGWRVFDKTIAFNLGEGSPYDDTSNHPTYYHLWEITLRHRDTKDIIGTLHAKLEVPIVF